MNDRPSALPATGRKTLWAWAVGTFFGIGLLKPGPGTWGSVAAMLLWLMAAKFGAVPFLAAARTALAPITPHTWLIGRGDGFPFLVTLLAVVCFTAMGIPAATRVARESGREDPGHVVIDEVAGQWLTLAICPPHTKHALVALALFRLFDVTKPWPIRKLEALPGGWGIMLDDLAAGLFGLIVLLVIQHWW
jgi:phosphatidylglycerophosphatase A